MRLINRALGFLLAALIAVASLFVVIEVIAFAVHVKPVIVHWPSWYRWAEKTRWKAGVVRFWSIVLIVVGLVLLVLELKPRRVTRLGVTAEKEATDAAMTRRGLAGSLRAAATGVDGVLGATVTVKRRRANVIVAAAAKGSAGASAVKEPVIDAVNDRLDDLQLSHRPRVRVRVATRRK